MPRVAAAAGRRAFPTDKRSNGLADSWLSLRRSLKQDHRPLLVVTSASAPSSPTFRRHDAIGIYSKSKTTNPKKIFLPNRNEAEVELDSEPSEPQTSYGPLQADRTSNSGQGAGYPDGDRSDFSPYASFSGPRDNESQEKLLQDDEVGEAIETTNPLHVTDEASPPFECDPDTTTLYSVYTIGRTGLTQSDCSLSSRNPPYSYGNQTEYQGDPDGERRDYVPSPSGSDLSLARVVHCQLTNPTVSDVGPMPCLAATHRDSADEIPKQLASRTVTPDPDDESVSSAGDCYQTAGSRSERQLVSSLKNRSSSDSSESRAKRKSVTFSLDDDGVCQFDEDVDSDTDLVDDVYEDGADDDRVVGPSDWFGKRRSQHEGSREEKTFLLRPEFEGVEPTYV